MSLAARVKGWPKLKAQLDHLPRDMIKEIGDQMRASGDQIRDEAKRLVPVKTGELRDHIAAFMQEAPQGLLSVVKIVPPEYRLAHIVEFGTHRSRAQPFLTPAAKVGVPKAKRDIAAAANRGIKRTGRR